MNKKILLSLVMVGMVAVTVVGATNAYFTGTGSSKNNSITTGSLKIGIDENIFGSLPFAVTNMQPGDSKKEIGAVYNNGTLPFNWKFSVIKTSETAGTGGGYLHNVLKSRIYSIAATSCAGADCTCPTTGTCVVNGQNLDCSSWGSWTQIWEGWMTEGTYPDKMGQLNTGDGVCFALVPYLQSDLWGKGWDATDNAYQMSNATYEMKVDAYQLNDPAY